MEDGSRDATVRQIAGVLLGGGLVEGWRLPPERELAVRLGTSRVTVRQALSALERSGIVAARRGSGVVVRHRREWTLGALPALVRAAGAGLDPALEPLAVEALALRRAFARRLPAEVAGRLAARSLDASRRAAADADAARSEPARLVALDAAALRGVFEAAGALGSAWLWNDLAATALALAERLRGPAPVAADYAARCSDLFDSLERGDTARAERLLGAHLSRLDRGLLAAFAPRADAGAPA